MSKWRKRSESDSLLVKKSPSFEKKHLEAAIKKGGSRLVCLKLALIAKLFCLGVCFPLLCICLASRSWAGAYPILNFSADDTTPPSEVTNQNYLASTSHIDFYGGLWDVCFSDVPGRNWIHRQADKLGMESMLGNCTAYVDVPTAVKTTMTNSTALIYASGIMLAISFLIAVGDFIVTFILVKKKHKRTKKMMTTACVLSTLTFALVLSSVVCTYIFFSPTEAFLRLLGLHMRYDVCFVLGDCTCFMTFFCCCVTIAFMAVQRMMIKKALAAKAMAVKVQNHDHDRPHHNAHHHAPHHHGGRYSPGSSGSYSSGSSVEAPPVLVAQRGLKSRSPRNAVPAQPKLPTSAVGYNVDLIANRADPKSPPPPYENPSGTDRKSRKQKTHDDSLQSKSRRDVTPDVRQTKSKSKPPPPPPRDEFDLTRSRSSSSSSSDSSSDGQRQRRKHKKRTSKKGDGGSLWSTDSFPPSTDMRSKTKQPTTHEAPVSPLPKTTSGPTYRDVPGTDNLATSKSSFRQHG